jgi:hypothetical protein
MFSYVLRYPNMIIRNARVQHVFASVCMCKYLFLLSLDCKNRRKAIVPPKIQFCVCVLVGTVQNRTLR